MHSGSNLVCDVVPIQRHSHVLLHLLKAEGLQHHMLLARQAVNGRQRMLRILKQQPPPCKQDQLCALLPFTKPESMLCTDNQHLDVLKT